MLVEKQFVISVILPSHCVILTVNSGHASVGSLHHLIEPPRPQCLSSSHLSRSFEEFPSVSYYSHESCCITAAPFRGASHFQTLRNLMFILVSYTCLCIHPIESVFPAVICMTRTGKARLTLPPPAEDCLCVSCFLLPTHLAICL